VVVREKKRFENTLDESVAAGLNAGTEVLMNQVRKSKRLINWWSYF
jgi:recyclin-1